MAWNPVFSLHVEQLPDESVPSSVSQYLYRFHKFSQYFKDVRGIGGDHIRHLVERSKELDIEYCKKEHLPPTNDKIQQAQKCFLENVSARFPLLDDETVEEDFFTYLLAPFDVAEKQTALLIRTTNVAKLVFVIHSVRVVLPEIRGSVPTLFMLSPTEWVNEASQKAFLGTFKTPRATFVTLLASDVKDVATDIANNLLKYMLKQIVNEVGQIFLGPILSMGISLIFNILFPPDISVFQQVYDVIKKIVKQELRQDHIKNINGALSNIGSALQNEYTPRCKSLQLSDVKHREILMSLLQKYDSTFLSGPNGMLGLLAQDEYQKPGLAAYILGVTLRISIFQECAIVDPAQKPDGSFYHPLESSYGKPKDGTVAMMASDAVTFVTKVWSEVREDRTKAICIHTWRKIFRGPMGPLIPMAEVLDNVTGQSWGAQEVDSSKEKDFIIPLSMYDLLDQKRKEAEAELVKQMGDPDKIISKWNQLIDKPLNMDPPKF